MEKPLYGFVPTCILDPMLFLMLVWFRFRQYKAMREREISQINE